MSSVLGLALKTDSVLNAVLTSSVKFLEIFYQCTLFYTFSVALALIDCSFRYWNHPTVYNLIQLNVPQVL